MKISNAAGSVAGVATTVVFLSACNGAAQLAAPRGAASTSALASKPPRGPSLSTSAFASVVADPNRGLAWMETAGAKGELLYVTDAGTNAVLVYAYPKLKLTGTLTGFSNPQGDCVDAAGDVWIVDTENSRILEYPHGGTTPSATLSDPGQYPAGCAVDPSTGNLAVSNFYSTSGPPGSIAIYKQAAGTPTLYAPPDFAVVYFLGYDARGTLYLDGIDSGSSFLFSSFDGKTFTAIELNQEIGGPGAVEAVGPDIVVGDQTNGANVAYAFAIRGRAGTLEKTTPLGGAHDVVQFYIEGRALVGGDFNPAGSTVDHFKYPAGGVPEKTASGVSAPIGAVLSRAAGAQRPARR